MTLAVLLVSVLLLLSAVCSIDVPIPEDPEEHALQRLPLPEQQQQTSTTPEQRREQVKEYLTSLDDIVDSLIDQLIVLANLSSTTTTHKHGNTLLSSAIETANSSTAQKMRVEVDQMVERILKQLHESESAAKEAKSSQEHLQEKVDLLEKSLDDDLPGNKVDYDSGDIQTVNGTLSADLDVKEIIAKDDPALMHEDIQFLSDLVYVIISASVFGALAVAMRVPMVVGFILGGMVIGPSGFSLIVQMKRIDTLAEIGASLILFVQGLEFDTSEMQKFRTLSMCNFAFQILIAGFGFTLAASWFLDSSFQFGEGFIIVISSALCSSTVAVNLANDYNLTHGSFFAVLGAMLLGQDLMMGLFLCLPEALRQGLFGLFIVLRQLIYAVVLVSGFIYLSSRIVPKTARFFLKTDIPQLFLLSTLSICLSAALLTSHLGLSAEFGSFFAGVALTRTTLCKESLNRIESTKSLFSVLLFSSIGMLISPSFVYHNITTIGILFCVIFLIKFLTSFTLLRVFKNNFAVCVLVALSVSQIAEFSMLIAGKAYVFGLMERQTYLIFLTVAVTTLFFNPLIFKLAMTMSVLKQHSAGRVISISGSAALKTVHSLE